MSIIAITHIISIEAIITIIVIMHIIAIISIIIKLAPSDVSRMMSFYGSAGTRRIACAR